MNMFQKAWRRQKATYRAREIRRYRKGHPKLGCYKCWYDCYEVEGDRCPECNAVIERDVPWWRDGRYSIGTLALIGMVPVALSIAGYIWFKLEVTDPSNLQSRNALVAIMIHRGALYVLAPLVVLFPAVRTRKSRHLPYRLSVAFGATLLWMLVITAITWDAAAV